MNDNEETVCHTDKVMVGGSEKGVLLNSHYFKNREGITFSFDALQIKLV